MMNVYQVVSDTNVGGAGRYLLNYVKHFNREHFKVTVLIPENSMLKPLLKDVADITVIEVPFMADKSYDKRCVKAMQEIFSGEKIDIVHTHASLSARIAARRAKAGAVVSTRHCIEPPGRFPASVVKGILNNLLCDVYVAVSDAVAQNLADCGIKREKIQTVCNGVEPVTKLSETERYAERNKRGILEDEMVFGVFARLEEVKGHQYFIEAAKQFLQKGGRGKFLIVGDGSLMEELKKQAAGVPEIIFTGYVPDTATLLNITDVNVLSSRSEAMSLAILEAMSLGIPTVATNVGGNPQLVKPKENGLLTEFGDSCGMAEAFLKMAENKAFYKQCAEHAGDLYRRQYTAQIMVKNLEKLYEEVANESK